MKLMVLLLTVVLNLVKELVTSFLTTCFAEGMNPIYLIANTMEKAFITVAILKMPGFSALLPVIMYIIYYVLSRLIYI